MNKRIFFLLLYFLIPFMVCIPPVYAAPTLTSVTISPNPAFTGETITISTVGSDAENTFIIATYTELSPTADTINRDANWVCQSFLTDTNAGTFHEAWWAGRKDATDDFGTGRIYEYIDSTHVGSILSIGTGHAIKGTVDASCEWKTLTWTPFEMDASTNYWFCIKNDTGSHPGRICPTVGSYAGFYATGGAGTWKGIPEPDSEVAMVLTDGRDLLFQIFTKEIYDVRLRSSIQTTPSHTTDDFLVSDFFSDNPSASIINPYTSNKTIKTVIQDEDTNTLSNEIETAFVVKIPLTDFVTCTAIENATCVVDKNSINVTPTNKLEDAIIKIETGANPSSQKSPIIIHNINDSGKQYKIHTATSSEYTSEIWNYDNTLTFGTTNYDSVQKIWKTDDEKYEYSFNDLILSDTTKYYKFEYYEPAYHWFTVIDSYWDNQLTPNVTDYNGVSTDLFQISTYSDMASLLTEPKFPAITSNLPNENYVFQFTARGNTAISGELKAGIVKGKWDVPATSLNLTAGYKTLSLTGLENGYIEIESVASTSREIWIQNYVISERGYFTKPVKVFDDDGSNLPVMILDENKYGKYVIEGKNFLVHSEYFDPDGDIDRYEITAYIDSVTTANKIKKWVFEAEDDGVVRIREVVGGLIDLTANAPDRTVLLTLRLVDENASYYEIQSNIFTMRQYPTNPRDLSFRVTQGDQLIGEHPKGRVWLETLAPENIIGVELNFLDSEDNNNSDFNKIFYKDVDFSCVAFDCSFDYEIEEYVFPSADNYRVEAWALVNTEEKTYAPPFNDLLHDFKSFLVSWIVFDTARIFQTIQRSDRTYRNDEVIPLVLQLRDSTGMPKTLKDRINVKLRLTEVNAIGGSKVIDLNYKPDSVFFDETTGYTYYHFRQVFVEEDYTPLSDGNYFLPIVMISDPTKTHQINFYPTLADKCQAIDPITFYVNMLTMNFFSDGTTCLGCTSGNCTDQIVAFDADHNAHAVLLLIDEDHSVTAPTQYWWTCTSPDQNNLYSDVLAQDILCWTWYLIGETPIDEFKFYLTNKHSDLSVIDEDLKQYIEVSVPYEYVYFNDMHMLTEALKQEFNTDWSSSNLPTIEDIILLQTSHFLGWLTSPTINVAGDFLTATGLIGNIGWEMGAVEAGNAVDFNFATPIDPRTISGVLTYRIRNINVINKKDYEIRYPELKTISPSKFTIWADLENVRLKTEPINIDVFVSDMVKILSIESNAKLVIDEEPRANRINIENLDTNAQSTNFQFLPTKITFRAISDMIYNNKLTFKRRYLILPFTLVLESKTKCGLLGIGCWGVDEPGSITAVFTEGDLSFFAKSWFLIMMAMIGILFISVVYGNMKGKGISIQMPFRRG